METIKKKITTMFADERKKNAKNEKKSSGYWDHFGEDRLAPLSQKFQKFLFDFFVFRLPIFVHSYWECTFCNSDRSVSDSPKKKKKKKKKSDMYVVAFKKNPKKQNFVSARPTFFSPELVVFPKGAHRTFILLARQPKNQHKKQQNQTFLWLTFMRKKPKKKTKFCFFYHTWVFLFGKKMKKKNKSLSQRNASGVQKNYFRKLRTSWNWPSNIFVFSCSVFGFWVIFFCHVTQNPTFRQTKTVFVVRGKKQVQKLTITKFRKKKKRKNRHSRCLKNVQQKQKKAKKKLKNQKNKKIFFFFQSKLLIVSVGVLRNKTKKQKNEKSENSGTPNQTIKKKRKKKESDVVWMWSNKMIK